jgi:hypothetical protein
MININKSSHNLTSERHKGKNLRDEGLKDLDNQFVDYRISN